jgi:RND family efflux transporter MFP subunit
MKGCSRAGVLLAGMVVLAAVLPAWAQTNRAAATNGPLASVLVKAAGGDQMSAFEGVVEAVRQSVIAAQVPGAVVALEVKAGDHVRTGQVVARLDARAALQTAAAGDAQVRAARAELEVASREVGRQRALFGKQYISQAALDRAEAQFKSTEAQVAAQLAQAGAARTQSGFYVLTAPYAGVVAEVSVVQGEMAMPGRALMTLYDPAALRVTAPVPQGAAARLGADGAAKAVRIELPGLPAERATQAPTRVTVLPAADPNTHSVPVRFDLAPAAGVTPGMFARVWLPGERSGEARLYVPLASVLRRAEMNVVYVLDATGKPLLRQVRLGRAGADSVEVLAGIASGERVATDPQAAARAR